MGERLDEIRERLVSFKMAVAAYGAVTKSNSEDFYAHAADDLTALVAALSSVQAAWADRTLSDTQFRIVISSILLGLEPPTEDDKATAMRLLAERLDPVSSTQAKEGK